MTGPEHLREGKRLLAESADASRAFPEVQALTTQAQAHLLAALIAVEVEDKLPDRVSWQEAVNQ